MASARVLTTNELGLIRYQQALITNSWPIEVRLLPQPNDTPHTMYTLHTPGNAAASFTSTRREELRATLNVRPGALVYEVLRDGILVSTGGLEVRPPISSPTSTSVSELRPSGARQVKLHHHHQGNVPTSGNNVIFEYNEMPWTVRQVSIVDEVTGRILTDLQRHDDQCDAGFSAACHLPVGQFLYRFRVVLLSQPTKPTRLGWDDGAMTQAWELMTWPLCMQVNDLSLPGAVPGDGMMRLDERLLNVPVKCDFHNDFDDDDDDDDDVDVDDDDDETMVDEDEQQHQDHRDLDLELEEHDNKENIKTVTSFSTARSSASTSQINSPVSSAMGKMADPSVHHQDKSLPQPLDLMAATDKAGNDSTLHQALELSRQTPSCTRDASYAGYDSSFDDEDSDNVIATPTTWSPKLGYSEHKTTDTNQDEQEQRCSDMNDGRHSHTRALSPLQKVSCMESSKTNPSLHDHHMDVNMDMYTNTASKMTKGHDALSLPPPSSTVHTLASVTMASRSSVATSSSLSPNKAAGGDGGGDKAAADVGRAVSDNKQPASAHERVLGHDMGSSATVATPIKVSSRSGTGKKGGGGRRGGGRKWTGMALNAAMFLLGTTVTLVMGRNRQRAFRERDDDDRSVAGGSDDGSVNSDDEKQQQQGQGDDVFDFDSWRSKSKRVSSFNVSVAGDDDEPMSFRWKRKSRRESDADSVRSGGGTADTGDESRVRH